jgi:hypothetical protein
MSEDPPRKKRPRPPTPEEMEAEKASTRRNGFIVFAVLCVVMPTLFLINLVREKHRHDEEMGLVPTKMVTAEANRATKVLDNEDDLLITPAVTKPSRHDVAFSIGSVLGDTKACFKAGIQGVQATWQVNPDGSATDVKRPRASSLGPAPGAADEEALACVTAAVKQARVAPFEGAPVHVTYTFRARAPSSP